MRKRHLSLLLVLACVLTLAVVPVVAAEPDPVQPTASVTEPTPTTDPEPSPEPSSEPSPEPTPEPSPEPSPVPPPSESSEPSSSSGAAVVSALMLPEPGLRFRFPALGTAESFATAA